MCGIFGSLSGTQNTVPFVVEGLRRQEYRGYDSTGIAWENNGQIFIHKKEGKLKQMTSTLPADAISPTSLGHTRWATHGDPCDRNAHPIYDQTKQFALVHNGIIENYYSLKQELIQKGYHFVTDTDTEVLVNLISYTYQTLGKGADVLEAVRLSLQKVVGTYGLCLLSTVEKDKIIVGRNKSPLILGLGKNSINVASDKIAFTDEVRELVYLNDGEFGYIHRNQTYSIFQLDGKPVAKTPETHHDEWSSEKGIYPHFMLKEIEEQQKTIAQTIEQLLHHTPILQADGSPALRADVEKMTRMVIVACGTSWHAGLVGKHYVEEILRIPVEVCYASEFRYNDPIIDDTTLYLFITQSGETADTIAALEEVRHQKGKTLCICNVEKSSITKLADYCVYTKTGFEIGVASTKAFTAQMAALFVITNLFALFRGKISPQVWEERRKQLDIIPALISQQVSQKDHIIETALRIKDARSMLFLGRNNLFPMALEGSLKMKEISYIHAEGYPAGEMKHGHIALVDKDLPVVFIVPAPTTEVHKKVISNMQEIKARNGYVVAVACEGDEQAASLADRLIAVPLYVDEFLAPFMVSVPLQLLAYHVAVFLGRDVDQPRNLAKSVTVE